MTTGTLRRDDEAGPLPSVDQIGAGCDGVSYRAQSEDEPAFLEVHELGLARQNPERWAWLVSRLRIAATYTHPAVIRVLELALEDDPPYVVRQCAGESTLAKLICERGTAARGGGLASRPSARRCCDSLPFAGTGPRPHRSQPGLVGRVRPPQARLHGDRGPLDPAGRTDPGA